MLDLDWIRGDVVQEVANRLLRSLTDVMPNALPFGLLASVSAHLSSRQRLGWALLFIAWAAGLVMVNPQFTAVLAARCAGLGYYVAACTAVYAAQPLVAAGVIRRDALFALCFCIFVFVPAIVFRLVSDLPTLVLGWCAALSAYSFCLEVRSSERPGLRACIFFLLADPTLVYLQRARLRSDPPPRATACMRVVAGIVLTAFGTFCVGIFPTFTQRLMALGLPSAGYLRTVVLALSAFVPIYALRSGMVHMLVGFTRLLGYDVGEGFQRPYLAASPSDFWRRWNLYVGDWARRYLFFPLSLALVRMQARLLPGLRLPVGMATAIVVTFACIGLLHDALTFAGQGHAEFPYLVVFLCGALALIAWEATVRGLYALEPWLRVQRRWIHAASRICALHYWVLLVALSGAIG